MEKLLKENPFLNNLRVSDFVDIMVAISRKTIKEVNKDPYPDKKYPKTNDEIGEAFGCCEGTVRNYYGRKYAPLPSPDGDCEPGGRTPPGPALVLVAEHER